MFRPKKLPLKVALIRTAERFGALLLFLCVISLTSAFGQVPVSLAPVARQQFFSPSGTPLSSGCVFTFAAGTSTPIATYADSSGNFQNTNPILLDAGGFATIYLANQSYKFQVVSSGGLNCASGQPIYTQDNISSYQQLSQLAALTLTCASADPSGVAGELACRSDLGKLRFFFSIWDSIVTETGIATLTNKTLTTPVINTPTVTTPILNGVSTGTGLQGSGTKLMTSSTVAGTGATLCTDATQAATTSGCTAQLPNVVYNTASAQFTATTALIPMLTPSATATYRFSGYLDQTILGSSCAGTSTYQLTLSWNDPNAAGLTTDNITWAKNGAVANTSSIVNNGAVGNISGTVVPFTVRVKTGTSIGFSFTVTPGGSCSPPPTVQFFPILEQLTVS